MTMVDKEILVTETAGVSRKSEYVRIGVPFRQGELHDEHNLTLVDAAGQPQPLQTTVLGRWHGGSIKWLLLDFPASVSPRGTSAYRATMSRDSNGNGTRRVRITRGEEVWLVDTGSVVFTIDPLVFRPFVGAVSEAGELLAEGGSSFFLDLDAETCLKPIIKSLVVETEGPLRATLRCEGFYQLPREEELRFSSRLHFFANSSRVELEFTLRNPRAAVHKGGLWDLGNPGSVLFRELALDIPFRPDSVRAIACSVAQGAPPLQRQGSGARLSVYQESSGGEQWQSPVHRNRDGKVPFTLKGYELQSDDGRVSHGNRATPLVWCGGEGSGVVAAFPRFWQEFPKEIEANRDHLRLALFPARFPGGHELQGGEQKTTLVHLDFNAAPACYEWSRTPLQVVVDPAAIRAAGVIHELPSPSGQDLTDRYIHSPLQLFAKRESADEFGWRNFGDIHADHEGVYHPDKENFVSHYNNQYDISAGLYRKFMTTGDPLWGELAADMARHVLDIDIYHTDQDREEYNGGLFWHTDHYISAGLSTHRSFSREHLQGKNPCFCGGGPAAEHGYTTGLLLHYYMTGNPDYREAVITLAEWIFRALTGPHTVLGVVRSLKGYLGKLRDASGTAFPRYPMTRGTGNTISACLDAFEAGGGRLFLRRAGELIRGALHPLDDIAARDLLDAENAWSYTVLLVAVTKYLGKKYELEELDEDYCYARGCLLAYGEWMRVNEYPYLDKPEILEYPNETWAAQDLRKSVVLYHAARHAAAEQRAPLLERARFFLNAARDELDRHPTSCLTRPMALMLQNSWVGARLEGNVPFITDQVPVGEEFGAPTPTLGKLAVLARITTELFRTMTKSSIQREIAWLWSRLYN
jgi:hypothetical protein